MRHPHPPSPSHPQKNYPKNTHNTPIEVLRLCLFVGAMLVFIRVVPSRVPGRKRERETRDEKELETRNTHTQKVQSEMGVKTPNTRPPPLTG